MSAVADVAIAGGGPAGMMAGYLFARAGLKTVVVEKHSDFLRDFRGDTVHPTTMELFHELGLLDAFLARPHERFAQLALGWEGKRVDIADLSRLPVKAPFIAFMPQWEFLDFLAGEARKLPNFELMMDTEADGLLEIDGTISGISVKTLHGEKKFPARLTIAADGRRSDLRRLSRLEGRDLGAPIDVLWFCLPLKQDRTAGNGETTSDTLINSAAGSLVITINRGSYWQCAFVIAKGGLDALKAQGLDVLRQRVALAAPHVGVAVDGLQDWDQVKLLSVAVNRLDIWSKPGFLAIGDAAHAMSPIGGVGINLAIQDAVAAANLLAPRLRAGELSADDLDLIRKRRLWPTRATQFAQIQIQNRVLDPLISGTRTSTEPPLPLRIARVFPPIRRLFARAIGLGLRPEHISKDLFKGV